MPAPLPNDLIRDACHRLRLTREDLARALGLSPDGLRRILARGLDERTRLAVVGLLAERGYAHQPNDDEEYDRLWAEAMDKLDAAGVKPRKPEDLLCEPREVVLCDSTTPASRQPRGRPSAARRDR